MAQKQSDYLASLLSNENNSTDAEGEPAPAAEKTDRSRGTTLLNRQSALARVASGEVRQVTQLLLDPARVRVWPGNARSYAHLSEQSCRELIDSIIAEGGQKVPAVIRRVENDPDYEYEVIAGTRRHWSISWLRRHSYPDMQFVGQIAQLDDEAAFRLADLENRARSDISDLERARNYAAALKEHYGNHLTRMASRLQVSKGWLSKMLKVAGLPDTIVAAFASPADIQLKPAYALAKAMDDKDKAASIRKEALRLSREHTARLAAGHAPLPAAGVLKALLAAGEADRVALEATVVTLGRTGRKVASLQSSNRQGLTLRLHSGSGANPQEVLECVRDLLSSLDNDGRGLRP